MLLRTTSRERKGIRKTPIAKRNVTVGEKGVANDPQKPSSLKRLQYLRPALGKRKGLNVSERGGLAESSK